jgi:hypothetical protein
MALGPVRFQNQRAGPDIVRNVGLGLASLAHAPVLVGATMQVGGEPPGGVLHRRKNASSALWRTIVRRPTFTRGSFFWLSQHLTVQGEMPPKNLAASVTDNSRSAILVAPFVACGYKLTPSGAMV